MRYEIISTIKEIYTFSVLLHPTHLHLLRGLQRRRKEWWRFFHFICLPVLVSLPSCPFWNTATISVRPSHFSFSSRLPFPFLLSDTPLNVFARANSHCYPSYKLRLGGFHCQIFPSFASYYKIYFIMIIYNCHMSTSFKSILFKTTYFSILSIY